MRVGRPGRRHHLRAGPHHHEEAHRDVGRTLSVECRLPSSEPYRKLWHERASSLSQSKLRRKKGDATRIVPAQDGLISRDRRAVMDRRTFIKAAAGVVGAGALAAPAIAQRGGARVLRFVPQADLANFDPIWNTQYVVRNAAALVWDMLYGFDDKLQPRRQMVESEEASSDGRVWTFRLRPGLKFHDGERVLASDVVASLKRWQARDNMGLM